MFGYVIANKNDLSEDELIRYRGCYCGLCRDLGRIHGSFSRLMLTYDLTFLALILNSLYEPDESENIGPCIMHPLKSSKYWDTMFTDYAADMTILLSYLKLIDDWNDDRKIVKLVEAEFLKNRFELISYKYNDKVKIINKSLNELSIIEESNNFDPDRASYLFGVIMGEVFVYKEDYWAPILRKMGIALGKFIYIMDAVMDLDDDINDNNYNSLKELESNDNYKSILDMLIGETVYYYDKLPIVRDSNIIKNILCSGIWTKYMNKFHPQNEEGFVNE